MVCVKAADESKFVLYPQIYPQTQRYQDYSQPRYPQPSLNSSQYNPIVQTYSTVPQTYQNVPQTAFNNNQHFTSNNFYAQPVQAQFPDQSLGIRVGDRIFRNGWLNGHIYCQGKG